MDVTLAHPEGYQLHQDVIDLTQNFAQENKTQFSICHSMEEAFSGADIVYPKSWAPYHVMLQRTDLLKKRDHDGLKNLEKECLVNNARFKSWECDTQKMKLTQKGEALYMHCLPADISGVSCKEGEVSADVFEKYRIHTYKEAGYKPFVIAAMAILTKFPNALEILEKMYIRNRSRLLL